jgi:ribosomal protein L37E
MADFSFINNEFIFISIIIYLLTIISVIKLGSERICGGLKAFIVSLFFTPLIGLIYVLRSSDRNTLRIIHYRCRSCGLEYTSKHKYCPSCAKDGRSSHLEKISMKTY